MSIFNKMTHVGSVGRNGQAYLMSINAAVEARAAKTIDPYNNNRKIDEKRVEEMASNFNPNSFGVMLAVPGKNSKGEVILHQKSAHHRFLAAELKKSREGSLGVDGNCNFIVKVFPSEEALRLYVEEGSAVGLKTSNLVTNPDFALTNFIKGLISPIDYSEYLGISLVTDSAYFQLACLITTLANNNDVSDITFKTAIGPAAKAEVKKLAGIPMGDVRFTLKLSKEKRHEFLAAVDYGIATLKFIVTMGDLHSGTRKTAKLSSEASSLISNKSFLNYLIWNRLTGGSVTQILPENLARILLSKDSAMVKDAINALKAKDFDDFAEKIYIIARTKTGYTRKG